MENIHFDREESFVRLQKVMENELSQWQQTVIRAFYFEGKSQAKIARENDLNRSSVCRTLHRAEHRLKRFLTYYA